jgi:hypothetical protein
MTSAIRVAERHLEAGGYQLAELKAILDKLQKKFRRAKLKLTTKKSGSAIWDHQIQIGSKTIVWVKESGWAPSMRYELIVYGDDGYQSANTLRSNEGVPTERSMWTIVSRVLAESPVLVAKLRQKGLTAPQVEALNQGIRTATTSVKALIATPLEVFQRGDVEAGDIWFRLSYEDEAAQREVIVFELVLDVGRKKFEAKSFGEKMAMKTIRGVVGLLNAADKLVKRGLRGLEAGERNMLLGKLTADSVVRKAVSTETDFSRIDEWQDTVVRVTLALRTSKKVPGKLLIQWVKDNWREVTPLINDKTPAPASSSSRGMSYDEPEAGLGWTTPSRLDPRNAEVSFLGQNGNRATVEVRESSR